MTVVPNGTDAKEIALHFVKLTTERATPMIMKKTIAQAKVLLESGYTKHEIIDAITYAITVKHVEMYSLGYINATINAILKEINKIKAKETAQLLKAEIKNQIPFDAKEVTDDGSSTRRNRDKLSRFGIQSRFGEKSDFNLFKEQ